MNRLRDGQRLHGPRSFAREAFRGGLLVRYLMVAVVKLALDFGAFNAMILGVSDPHWGHLLLANSVGFIAAGWVAYRLNASFAFRVDRRPGDLRRFLIVSLIGGLLYNTTLVALVALSEASGGVELNLAKLAALGASAGWNFVGSALFVFRRPAVTEATLTPEDRRDAA